MSSSSSPTPDGSAHSNENKFELSNAQNADDDDEVWDPAAEKHPRESELSSSKSEDNASATNTVATTATATAIATTSTSDWQAIWSAAHGAYYFYNTATKETTWINPLAPPSESADVSEPTTSSPDAALVNPSSSSTNPDASSSNSQSTQQQQPSSSSFATTTPSSYSSSSSSRTLLPTADPLGGIDPELAFLDPSLAYTGIIGNKLASSTAVPTFTAKFNARSGRFAASGSGGGEARDPNHVSEYERAKRMSEAYFDVDVWKKQVEEREQVKKRALEQGEDPNAKRKKPTKADLVRTTFFENFHSYIQSLMLAIRRNDFESKRRRRK